MYCSITGIKGSSAQWVRYAMNTRMKMESWQVRNAGPYIASTLKLTHVSCNTINITNQNGNGDTRVVVRADDTGTDVLYYITVSTEQNCILQSPYGYWLLRYQYLAIHITYSRCDQSGKCVGTAFVYTTAMPYSLNCCDSYPAIKGKGNLRPLASLETNSLFAEPNLT